MKVIKRIDLTNEGMRFLISGFVFPFSFAFMWMIILFVDQQLELQFYACLYIFHSALL